MISYIILCSTYGAKASPKGPIWYTLAWLGDCTVERIYKKGNKRQQYNALKFHFIFGLDFYDSRLYQVEIANFYVQLKFLYFIMPSVVINIIYTSWSFHNNKYLRKWYYFLFLIIKAPRLPLFIEGTCNIIYNIYI